MSIVKLSTVAAVLILPVALSACGSSSSNRQTASTASTVQSSSSTQQTASSRDYEASERIYNRSLRK